ncbi:MAG: NAD(P)/FAD-dependent oxidoreductase [Phycisphaerales bacterium]
MSVGQVFDHAVIGAGAAGASAALRLARGGRSVVVFESRAFPRAKVCGEFVSPAAGGILEELLGGAEGLGALGARRVEALTLERGDRRIGWRMPGAAWVLSRRALDAALLDAARDAGALVEQPARVVGVGYPDDAGAPVEVRLGDGRVVRARTVLHCDGSGRYDRGGAPVAMRAGVVGLKCHLRVADGCEGLLAPGLGMRSGAGVYLGTVRVEDGQATVALVCRASLLRAHGADADALVGAVWEGFDASWRTTEWMSCGVAGSGYVGSGDARSFRLGNAAAAVEPVGGEGIGLALWSARTLSGLLMEIGGDGLCDAGALGGVERAYGRAYRRRLRWRRPACRGAAEVLMRPRVVDVLWPVLRMPVVGSGLIGWWYALTGKAGVGAGSGGRRVAAVRGLW